MRGATVPDTLEYAMQHSTASNQPTMADLQEREKLYISSHDTTSRLVTSNPNQTQDDNNNNNNDVTSKRDFFPFLSLPLELRLKIYTYILPPRHHKIVTSLPPTNYFYNTSSFPPQTTYPFGRSSSSSPNSASHLASHSTPYKVLTKNSHISFPHQQITVALLQTCKQIHAEAEPVFYGSAASVLDFGVHIDALRAFWEERSRVAREFVRSLRLGFEVPGFGVNENGSGGEMLGRKAAAWQRMVELLVREMRGLRRLDLMLWCADGTGSGFPEKREREMRNEEACSCTHDESLSDREIKEEAERRSRIDSERRWREWKWTEDLLYMPSLRETRITCWTALPPRTDEEVDFGVTVPKFNSWLAGRMVADEILRHKMVKDGAVSEEVVVLGASAA